MGFVDLGVLRVWCGQHVKCRSELPRAGVAVDGANSDSRDQGGSDAGAFRGVFVLALVKGPGQDVRQNLAP